MKFWIAKEIFREVREHARQRDRGLVRNHEINRNQPPRKTRRAETKKSPSFTGSKK